MKIFRLSAALTATVISLMPGFHARAIAVDPDYLCFMLTPSGKSMDLSQSLCHSGNSSQKVVSTDQAFVDEYMRQAMNYPDLKDSLLASIKNSPQENIRKAKDVCESLEEGLSLDEIAQQQAGENNDKSKLANATIINNLATKYYCPGISD